MKNIVVSAKNGVNMGAGIACSAKDGAITGAKVGGVISASAFLIIVGAVSFELMNDPNQEKSVLFQNQNYLMGLMGSIFLGPLVGAISGGLVGTVKGVYTSIYGQKIKVESEPTLPLHHSDMLVLQRKTRSNELS